MATVSQNERVLNFLAKGHLLLTENVEKKLGITRETLPKRIYDLRQAGWVIYSNKATRNRGFHYRLSTEDQKFYSSL